MKFNADTQKRAWNLVVGIAFMLWGIYIVNRALHHQYTKDDLIKDTYGVFGALMGVAAVIKIKNAFYPKGRETTEMEYLLTRQELKHESLDFFETFMKDYKDYGNIDPLKVKEYWEKRKLEAYATED